VQAIHRHEATFLWEEPRRRRLVGLCAAVSGSRDAAEDLAQETLLEAWRNAHKLTEPEGADRWLAAIARNVCRRWVRSRARSAPEVPAEPAALVAAAARAEEELTRPELVDALDRALGTLPRETRSVLVARYVEDLPHAQIAEQLGVSEDAVAMRLSRGKASLRRLVAVDDAADAGAWRETRLWCTTCGRARMSMRHGDADGTLEFRCGGCDPDSAVTLSEFRLDNPTFAAVVGRLARPATIRERLSDWSLAYFLAASETGGADCTRCGANARVTGFSRSDVDQDSSTVGLLVECPRCGEQVWLSAAGAALALPETRAFLREHPRAFVLPRRELDFGGRPAVAVAHQDLFGHARVEAIFQRDTLRVLDVRAA